MASHLIILLLLASNCIDYNVADHTADVPPINGPESTDQLLAGAHELAAEPIETIVYTTADGIEHEEYAFREPARGVPEFVLDMFCSSVKLRLYWDQYRSEVKSGIRKGLYLRRMARLARHIFADIRDADKPFNNTMLSTTDDYFNVKLDAEDKRLDEAISARVEPAGANEEINQAEIDSNSSVKKLKSFKEKLSKKLSDSTKKLSVGGAKSSGGGGVESKSESNSVLDEIESSETIRELESQGDLEASAKIKQFAKTWGPKVVLAIYTRWRTMWWMMMSCLYTKYYLWDPALDEFIKLKRNLVMWPQLQVLQMKDLQCKPLMFFKRLMDVCKVLNPLMNFNFGQFDLDKLTRFKSDS